MVEVNNLSKDFRVYDKKAGLANSLKSIFNRKYKMVSAVKNVSFSLKKGEIVGFIGPNGAGKTTTLKLLAGLLHPTQGKIKVNGLIPKDRKVEFLKSITMIMGQKQQIAWDLTPSDAFLVNKVIFEIPEQIYQKQLAQLIDVFKISEVINKQVRKLSLGQRMKCEIAAALLHQPKILFLDEPTVGLDVHTRTALYKIIHEYNTLHDTTMMVTSHYMTDIVALAERVIIIDGGRLIKDEYIESLVGNLKIPSKVRIKFRNAVNDYSSLHPFEVSEEGNATIQIKVEKALVAKVIEKSLKLGDVVDISVQEASIDEILSDLISRKS